MASKLKRKPTPKPPNVKKNRIWIGTRGKYLTVRELVYNVHLMNRNGMSLMAIAATAQVDHRTVKRILLRPPEEAFPDLLSDDTIYVIASELALPSNLKPEDYPFEPLQGPWLHGAKLSKSDLLSVMERVRAMGSDYGVIEVYRTELVDLRTVEEEAVTEYIERTERGTNDGS